MKNLRLKISTILLLILSAFWATGKTPITGLAQVKGTPNVKIDWGESDIIINPPGVTMLKYQIRYKAAGGSMVFIDNISPSLRTYTLTGLSAGVKYDVEVWEVIRVSVSFVPGNPTFLDKSIGSGVSTITLNAIPTAVCTAINQPIGSNGFLSIAASQVGQNSTDPDNDFLTYSQSPAGPFAIGTHNVTLTVKDPGGLSSSCSTTIRAYDATPPVVKTKSITLELDERGIVYLPASWLDDGSYDNGGYVAFSVNKDGFYCSDLGDNQVIFTVSDGSAIKTSEAVNVTVVDKISPVAITKNAAIFLDAEGQVHLESKWVNNGSYDNCGITDISFNQSYFYRSDVGIHTITMTVTDASGNKSSATAILEVKDLHAAALSISKEEAELPVDGSVIDSLSSDSTQLSLIGKYQTDTLYLDSTGAATLTAEILNDSTFANTDSLEISISKTEFGIEDLGGNTVWFYAKDGGGNIDSVQVIIVVLDTLTESQETEIAIEPSGLSKTDLAQDAEPLLAESLKTENFTEPFLITEPTEKLMTYGPNPTNGNFNLYFKTLKSEEVSLTVFDTFRKVHLNFNSNIIDGVSKLDLEKLKKGTYLVHIKTKDLDKVIRIRKD